MNVKKVLLGIGFSAFLAATTYLVFGHAGIVVADSIIGIIATLDFAIIAICLLGGFVIWLTSIVFKPWLMPQSRHTLRNRAKDAIGISLASWIVAMLLSFYSAAFLIAYQVH